MRWLLLGALLGLLLAVFPHLPAVALGATPVLLSQPLLVAFGLGLAAGLRTRSLRRWAA